MRKPNVSQTDEAGADASTIWRTLVLETRPLGFDLDVCIRLRELDRVGRGREERFGFRQAEVPGLTPEVASLYAVFSKGGVAVALPSRLQQALLDVCGILSAAANPSTRFGPRGWGIGASNVWLDRKALRSLLDAAERISGSL